MKYKFFILLIILIILMVGCSKDNSVTNRSVHFYYTQNELEFGTESGVIVSTERAIDGDPNDYFYLLSQYLNGPTSYDCISPFPAGTALEELNWDQNRVQIVLSPHITTLSGTDLMVACACLTKTASELIGINTIQIRSSSGLLNGEKVLTLTSDSFMYWDQTSPQISEK